MRLAHWSIALLAMLAPATAQAVTLPEMLAGVYETSPRLLEARARLQAVDEEVPLAQSLLRPQLRAGSSQGAARIDSQNDGSSTSATTRNTLELRQPLYTGGEATAGRRRAERLVMAEQARLVATEQVVLLEAVDAYAGIVLARRVDELAAANEARHRTLLEGSIQRYRFGDLTATDVAQAESRLARASADRELARGDLATAAADFERVAGSQPGKLAAVPARPDLPRSITAAHELAAEHPALRAAGLDLDAARAAIGIAESALRPRLALTGQVGYVDLPEQDIGRRTEASAALVLTVPIYQGGSEYARIRRAKQEHAQSRYGRDDVQRAVQRDVTRAWQARATAGARAAALRTQARAARIALDGVRQEALAGTRALIEVLDAEEDLFEAEVALARSLSAEIVAGWTLEAAIGRLDHATLGLPVTPFDAGANSAGVQGRWFGRGPPTPPERD